jgi:hypothetical protein
MSETELQAVDTPAPDANAAPLEESEAVPSPAVNDADENEVIRAAKGVGKRIDELTRLRRDAERERDHWRDLHLRSQPQPPPKAESQPDKAKTLADFDYDEGRFQSYIFEQAEKRSVEAARRELRAEKESEARERRKTTFASKASDFAKTVSDYDSVVRNPDLPITAEMAEAIQDSEDGPALAYHLGKNPKIAESIAQLPPYAAAREIGKIEARLAFEREKAKEKSVSKAPPPPPKVEGNDSPVSIKVDTADSDTLSDDEWTRRRNKQLERRRS